MKRLVSTVGLPKAEWLAYRKAGITGTDAGAILGVSPYVSAFQVYQNKISPAIEEADNEAMRQGRDLEEYVAQRFTEETGLKVRRANAIYQSEEHPILLADFDRIIVGQKAGLECKTVSPYSADQWKNGKIPPHYLAQVNHYLAVSGFDCWYIAALIFGQELIIHKILRDEAVIQGLIKAEEAFWAEYVAAGVTPMPSGSKGDTAELSRLYGQSEADKSVDLKNYAYLLEYRQEIVEKMEELEREKASIDQQIKLKMKEAAYGTAPSFKVSWLTVESNRMDTTRLKKELPEIYKKYCYTSTSRRFTVDHAA